MARHYTAKQLEERRDELRRKASRKRGRGAPSVGYPQAFLDAYGAAGVADRQRRADESRPAASQSRKDADAAQKAQRDRKPQSNPFKAYAEAGGSFQTPSNPLGYLAGDPGVGGLEALLGGGGMPTPPVITPALVDIAATLAPFAKARERLDAGAVDGRKRLDELFAHAVKDIDTTAAKTKNRLVEMETLRALQNEREVAEAGMRGGAALADAEAAGVDASALAALQLSDRAIQDSAASRSEGQKARIADQQATNDQQLDRNQFAQRSSDRAARQDLDKNLFAAMADLASQEQSARVQAEQFNAQAKAEAEQANYQAQMQQYGMQQDLAMRQFEAQGGTPEDQAAEYQAALVEAGAYSPEYPGQADVLRTLDGWANQGLASVFRKAFTGADRDGFRNALELEMDQYEQERLAQGLDEEEWQYDWSRNADRIAELVDQYYAEGGLKLDESKAAQIRMLYQGMPRPNVGGVPKIPFQNMPFQY